MKTLTRLISGHIKPNVITIRKCLIPIVVCLFIFSYGASAQNIHSKITDYPTYKNLVMAGYQGWFRAPKNGLMYPDETMIKIDMWPDISEYEKTYPTGFKLADGSTALFFKSTDKSTVD